MACIQEQMACIQERRNDARQYSPTAPRRLLIAENRPIVRLGLTAFLDTQPDFEVVGYAEDGLAAVAAARSSRPHVVLIKRSLPVLSGFDATEQIKRYCPDVEVVILARDASAEHVAAARKSRASALVTTSCQFEYLADVVRRVGSGERWIGPRLAQDQEFPGSAPRAAVLPCDLLTRRERQVLKLIAEGYRSRAIASNLFISVKTVEKHRSNVMKKLDVHSVSGLTTCALRWGLTEIASLIAYALQWNLADIAFPQWVQSPIC